MDRDATRRLPRPDPGAAFLLLLAVFGLAFAALTPPFQAPDEVVHVYRAYAVAEGRLFASRHEIPISFRPFTERMGQMYFHPERKTTLAETRRWLAEPLRPDLTFPASFPAATVYPPLIYLPQAAGVGLARALGLGPAGLLYAARLANLAVFALLGWLAVREAPSHRWLTLALLLLPMMVFLAGSASPDGMTNGLAALLIARALRMASDRGGPVTWRGLAGFALLAALVAATKVPYFLLALVFLLIPAAKFPSARARWAMTGALLALVALTVLAAQLPLLVQDGAVRDTGLFNRSPQVKIERMTTQPLAFAAMVARTLLASADNYYRSYVGVLGWLDTPLPAWVYWLAPLALLLAAQESVPGLRLDLPRRLLALGTGALVVLAVMALIYVNHTRLDKTLIEGVQGRYFLPLGPLPYLALASERAARRAAPVLPWLVMAWAASSLAAAVLAMAARYYA